AARVAHSRSALRTDTLGAKPSRPSFGMLPPMAMDDVFTPEQAVNLDKFTVTLSQGEHLNVVHGRGTPDIPGRWNKIWDAWIKANPKATAKEIYQQLGKMMDEFQLNNLRIHEYREP